MKYTYTTTVLKNNFELLVLYRSNFIVIVFKREILYLLPHHVVLGALPNGNFADTGNILQKIQS